MGRWTKEEIDRLFEQFAGPVDSTDPRVLKKQRIIKSATDLFIRQGYRKTSVDEIAREAGVAKGTVYLYFKNKAELVIHAIVTEKRAYIGLLEPCFDPDAEPREKLRNLVRAGLVMGSVMPMTSKLISGDREFLDVWDELPAEFMRERMSMGHGFYVDFLGEATASRDWAPGEFEKWGRVLMSLVYFSGMIVEEKVRMGLSVEQIAETLADMVIDGIDGPCVSDDATGTSKSQGGQS
jgi:AcrR family transcriptional regulator